jgi:HK97 family phage major capsid protein
MKISEMIEQRKALHTERDALVAIDALTPEQESRGHELANELQQIDGQIRAAQIRERFASNSALERTFEKSEERATEQRATKQYREQFIGWIRGGAAPELREVITTSSSGVLVPKVYEEGMMEYLNANTVVRNLADLKTGVKGYPTIRWNTLETNAYTSAWTQIDSGSTASTSIDPGFSEAPIPPIPCGPYTQVSRQALVQSNFDLETEIVDTLQRQLSKNLEWGYVGGSGSSQPTGIFKVDTNCQTTTATSTGTTRALAVSAGITVAKLTEMRYTKLPAAYWGSAAWILPQDAYAALAGIQVNSVPIFVPSADFQVLQNAAPFTLMGLPVYVTEYLPAHVSTATTGKNVVAVLANVNDAFSIREWGGMTMYRDELTAASSGRIKFGAWMFANSLVTRAKAMVQLQVTNA